MNQAKCTTCGAGLTVKQGDKTCVCDYCQTTNIVENALALGKVEVDVTKDIKKLRDNLATFVQQNSIDEILRVSQKLLDWIPQDFVALYFFAYAKQHQNQTKFIYAFFENPTAHTTEEWEIIKHHLFEHSELRDKKRILQFLEQFDKSSIEDFLKINNKRQQAEENYANVPRDVFICYSTYNQEIANEIVSKLENDGYTCWISNRNLRPNDSENYWSNIKNAIKKSSLFFVVSSEESMRSKDVQRELEIAIESEIPRVEYKIDKSKQTTFFKYAFDGIKWIEHSNDFESLLERVHLELRLIRSTHQESTPKVLKFRSKISKQLARFFALIAIFMMILVSFNTNRVDEEVMDEVTGPIITVENETNNSQSTNDNNIEEHFGEVENMVILPEPPRISISSKVKYFTNEGSNVYRIAQGFDFQLPEIEIDYEDLSSITYFLDYNEVEQLSHYQTSRLPFGEGEIVIFVKDIHNQKSNEIRIPFRVVEEMAIPTSSITNGIRVQHTKIIKMKAIEHGVIVAAEVTEDSPFFDVSYSGENSEKYNSIALINNDFSLEWLKTYHTDDFNIVDFSLTGDNILLNGDSKTNDFCSVRASAGRSASAMLLRSDGEVISRTVTGAQLCDSRYFAGTEINGKTMLIGEGYLDENNVRRPSIFIDIFSNDFEINILSNNPTINNPNLAQLVDGLSFNNGITIDKKYFNDNSLNNVFMIIDNSLVTINQMGDIVRVDYIKQVPVTYFLSVEDNIFNVLSKDESICQPYYLQWNHYDAITVSQRHIIFVSNAIRTSNEDCSNHDEPEIDSVVNVLSNFDHSLIKQILLDNERVFSLDQLPNNHSMAGSSAIRGYILYTGNSIRLLDEEFNLTENVVSYTEISTWFNKVNSAREEPWKSMGQAVIVFSDDQDRLDRVPIISIPVAFIGQDEVLLMSRNGSSILRAKSIIDGW